MRLNTAESTETDGMNARGRTVYGRTCANAGPRSNPSPLQRNFSI